MKIQFKLGIGITKKKKRLDSPLKKIVSTAKKSVVPDKAAHSLFKSTLQSARAAARKVGDKSNVNNPRISHVTKQIWSFSTFSFTHFCWLQCYWSISR